MFYLLQNNRKIQNNIIIDSNKYDDDSLVFYEALAGTLLYEVIPSSIRTEIRLGLIKNQSENVFDLIDKKQDLVEIDGQIIMARTIQGDIRNLSGITAIYKPNANGDYIKVWERKEE